MLPSQRLRSRILHDGTQVCLVGVAKGYDGAASSFYRDTRSHSTMFGICSISRPRALAGRLVFHALVSHGRALH